MENIVLPIILAIIGSGSMTAVITAIINKISKGDPSKVAIRLLLQDKLEFLCIKYINSGKVTHAQKKFVNSCYRCYKSLGGNGDMEDLMREFDSVDVIYAK